MPSGKNGGGLGAGRHGSPDTRAGNFIPNMAVVVCKGIFHDAPEPQLQNKVSHFMTIA